MSDTIVAFEYEDGSWEEYSYQPRGVVKAGKRPITAYVVEMRPYQQHMILMYLQPMKGEIKDLYKPTNKYIIQDNELKELKAHALSNELFIAQTNKSMLKYEEHLDGVVINKDEAMEKFPEYFV